jgi:hypothetical protein
MDATEWSHRLNETFRNDGMLSPFLTEIIAGEERYVEALGPLIVEHTLLLDCFQAFWIETLQRALLAWPARPADATTYWYRPVLDEHIAQLRSLRGAEILLRHGYPTDGYALLRDMLEQAILYAAMGVGLTSFARMRGFDVIAHEALNHDLAAERQMSASRRGGAEACAACHAQRAERIDRPVLRGLGPPVQLGSARIVPHSDSGNECDRARPPTESGSRG